MTGNNSINGDELRARREKLNLSQQDMALVMNVSRVTYIKWEQDPTTMTIAKYRELIDELERLEHIKESKELEK